MTTTSRWLIDTSAARLSELAVNDVLTERLERGLVGVCIVTELELGYSARSARDHAAVRADFLDQLLPVPVPVAAEQVARDAQRGLIERGQHRGVAVPDLLVAAVAQVEGLIVLHYDADFDLIAAVTGQPTEWVVPRGTLSSSG